MLKSVGFRKEEEVPCLFIYGGNLGQTKNTSIQILLVFCLKKYKLFEC